MIRTNMTIKIYRSDVEKMKEKLKSRMDKIWDIYRWHNHIETHLQSNKYFVEYLPAYDVYVEVNKTDYLTWKANKMLENEDFEFYKYLTHDFDFNYSVSEYASHLEAKRLMKERNYIGALQIMKRISEEKAYNEYNAHFMFCLYADIEACAKQILDFETAYKYSSKRLSLIESFKS